MGTEQVRGRGDLDQGAAANCEQPVAAAGPQKQFGLVGCTRPVHMALDMAELEAMRTVGEDELLSKVLVAPESSSKEDSFNSSMSRTVSKLGRGSRCRMSSASVANRESRPLTA
ncbi:hypothetical protein Tco_1522550 [Tanacetum coccineum]